MRRIFELCARGEGLKGITKILNADGWPPRARSRAVRGAGRRRRSAPSSIATCTGA